MASRAERRRQQRELEEARRRVNGMIAEARQIGLPFPSPPQLVTRIFGGWEWCVSCNTHRMLDHKNVEHWHVSAMLYPKGRSSHDQDWEFLGYVMHLLYSKSTNSDSDAPLPLTRFENTHPNRPHHWAWHGDRSPMDTCGVDLSQAFLDDLYREPDEEKRKRRLAQAFFSNAWKKMAKA